MCETKQDRPPHYSKDYDCGCCACASWRISQLTPGDIVTPVRLDPKKYSSSVSTIPIWKDKDEVSFSFSNRISCDSVMLFVGFVSKTHRSYYLRGANVLPLNKDLTKSNDLYVVIGDNIKLVSSHLEK